MVLPCLFQSTSGILCLRVTGVISKFLPSAKILWHPEQGEVQITNWKGRPKVDVLWPRAGTFSGNSFSTNALVSNPLPLLSGKAAQMLTSEEITKESEMSCWRTFRPWRWAALGLGRSGFTKGKHAGAADCNPFPWYDSLHLALRAGKLTCPF